jgi:hypothetical protein
MLMTSTSAQEVQHDIAICCAAPFQLMPFISILFFGKQRLSFSLPGRIAIFVQIEICIHPYAMAMTGNPTTNKFQIT